MPAHRYGAMLAMITAGRLRPERLVGRTVTLEQGAHELTTLHTFPGVGATVINAF
jgi:alcohol dehydrogenase